MDGLVAQFEHWGDKVLHTQALSNAVNVGVFLLVVASATQWGWNYYQRSTAPGLATNPASIALEPETPSDLDRLLTIELFGHATTDMENTVDLPVSSLNIVLKGVVAAGGESLALISVDGKEQLPYSIGQEIAHGAVLDAVHADRIIVLRQGVRESVMLQELSPAISLAPVRSTPKSPRVTPTTTISKIKPNQYAVNRSFVRQQLQSPKLLTQALILPDSSGGFKLRAVSSGSVYEQAGLQSGDIIKRVNGHAINSVDQAMNLYRKLGGIDRIASVNLEINRNGSMQRILYSVQ